MLNDQIDVEQLSGNFQPNEPIPSPNRDRSGQTVVRVLTDPCKMEEKSHSQEIDVNSFHEETVLRIDRDNPLSKRLNPNTFI